ncbi:YggS family pyridoxal phosphate-dependent enzyme [Helicobacter sp. 16-1353]|uniref:YggS family pyridoxal phosphate-dependent enzyme n=1 Tax=Helicobacter sp. 16-1353 TaxID=2004996 RepID=UPI000DCE4B6F|nr:YggS family pyridoxal phosphate-dependent enzyme [Helicobacter sp. 16-1353]RAX55361.1 YggS family pyridoxal phosphate-dependent enzyme [Helicobacter sp. 16-1353]
MIDKTKREVQLKENLRILIENIEEERLKYSSHQIIQLVAVSKYVSLYDIVALYNAGQRTFGENKVQDLKLKAQSLDNLPIQWHMIGTLQENKINQLISLKPTMLQSLDSIKLAKSIQSKLEQNNTKLNCLLQVNSSNELTKSGFSLDSAIDSYKEILEIAPNINLQGIMTIATNTDDKKIIESCFKKTKDIFDKLTPIGAKILSCGMSDDYKIAIANGANMLRIGSRIFK